MVKQKSATKKLMDDVAKTIGEGVKQVGNRASEAAKLAKVKLEIFSLNQKIKECERKIGDIVYTKNIKNLDKQIDEKITEINELYKDIEKEKEHLSKKDEKGGEK